MEMASLISPRSSFSSTGRSGPSVLNSSLTLLPNVDSASTSQLQIPGFNAICTALAHPNLKPNPLRQSARNAAAVPPVKPSKTLKIELSDVLSRYNVVASDWAELQRLSSLTEDNEFDRLPAKLDIELLKSSVPAKFFDPSFSAQENASFDYIHSIGREMTQQHVATVTMELQRHIALHSKDFFKILASIKDLQGESKLCLSSLTSLRRDLSRIQQFLVEPQLVRLALNRRRENLVILKQTINDVKSIVTRYEDAFNLHSTNRHEALNLVEKIELDLGTFNSKHHSVRILQEVSSKMIDMKEVIAEKYIEELSNKFISLSTMDPKSTAMSICEIERCGVNFVLDFLIRLREETPKNLSFPIMDKSKLDIVTVIKQYQFIMENIETIKTLVCKYDGCVEELENHPNIYSQKIISSLFEFLDSIDIKISFQQFSITDKVLENLNNQMSMLGLNTQHLQFHMIEYRKSWFTSFHSLTISQMAKLVEEEQWSPQPPTNSAQMSCSELALEPAIPMGKLLVLGGREFHLVPAVGSVLDMLKEYKEATENLPNIVLFIMSRFTEFLKQFNSRTCQVVLGAGAMRSAGLKNITAKHLALASQSLSIMIDLIPRFKLWDSLKSDSLGNMADLDRLRSDFQEHQYEIHAKLVSIMGDRLTTHVKSLLLSVDNAPTIKENENARTWAQSLSKETTTLHKVISKYLPAEIVEMIVGQVFTDITSRLSETFSTIDIKNESSKNQLLVDARFIYKNLVALKDVTPPPDVLEAIINGRLVLTPDPPVIKPAIPSENVTSPRLSSEASMKNNLSENILDSTRLKEVTPTQESTAPQPPRLSLAERLRTSSGLSFIRKSTPILNPNLDVSKKIDVLPIIKTPLAGNKIDSPLQFSNKIVDSPTQISSENISSDIKTPDNTDMSYNVSDLKPLPSTPNVLLDSPHEAEVDCLKNSDSYDVEAVAQKEQVADIPKPNEMQ